MRPQATIVDIVCSVLNGERFLPEFIASLQQQTHEAWRLWLRDDGSNDRTVELFTAAAGSDARIQTLHIGGPRLGVAQSFGWMLERAPRDARYILTADADDVWLPRKIERTLEVMSSAERESGANTPILVHTDLTVVDDQLRVHSPSFWQYSALRPEQTTLRRIVVRNPATGPTIMLNAALRERIGRTPPEATHHDWWYALVAAATGRIVALHESTVLYRQHGTNDVGAQNRGRIPLRKLPVAAKRALAETQRVQAWLGKTAAQAGAILERYGESLDDADREFLSDYSAIPHYSSPRRKMELLRLGALPDVDLLRRLGVLLRS